MTPEERKLVTDLFDRLASLEDNPRDPNAVDAINEGLERAPNAVYALVQTVLVQDEALKRADARIRALEGGAGEAPPQDTSFLGGLRNQILGRREETRGGSVPSVRPGAPSTAWHNTGAPAAPQPMQAQAAPEPMQQRGGMGGSFLGTAAAAAAGVVGGSLLDGRHSLDDGAAARATARSTRAAAAMPHRGAAAVVAANSRGRPGSKTSAARRARSRPTMTATAQARPTPRRRAGRAGRRRRRRRRRSRTDDGGGFGGGSDD